MTVVNPVTITTAVRTVGAAWNILTGGGGLSKEEKRAIEAAQQAGYTRYVRGWKDPSGKGVSQRDVIRAGRAAQISVADLPPAGARPADPGYRPDITEKRIPPLKRPPPTPAPPTSRVPKIPGRFGRIIEGIVTVGGGILGSEAILRQIPTPAPRVPVTRTPPPPPVLAPPGASYPEIAGPRPPFVPRVPVTRTPPPPVVASPIPAPLPQPAPSAPIDTERLGPIDVYVPYAAIPAPPAPSGAVTPAPRTVLGMSPAQLAGLAVPTLLALLAGSSSGGRRRRDPLTQPQPLAPGGPTLGLPFVPGLPGSGLTPGAFPLPFPGSGFGGGSGGQRTLEDQCRELSRRKRKPKRKREVCYSGRYIERASGLSKTKLRKVPCR